MAIMVVISIYQKIRKIIMFDLLKNFLIIEHLKKISSFYKISGNEIQTFCPYCDDATRSSNPSHGHLYISISKPIFFCFRCNTSGSLLKLLLDTEFKDNEVLQSISGLTRYKSIYDYNLKKIKKDKDQINIDQIIQYNLKFRETNPKHYEIFKSYLNQRIGRVNTAKFLITPGYINNKLVCNFSNSENESVISRFINNQKIRYAINKKSSGLYFFQNKNFEKYKNIILTEGPFDCINIYLYNNQFKDNFFISILGKKYLSVLEKLIFEELLIGRFYIHLIFDSDVSDYKRYIYRCRKLINIYNKEIIVNGYRPIIGKDTGDFPGLIKCEV